MGLTTQGAQQGCDTEQHSAEVESQVLNQQDVTCSNRIKLKEIVTSDTSNASIWEAQARESGFRLT